MCWRAVWFKNMHRSFYAAGKMSEVGSCRIAFAVRFKLLSVKHNAVREHYLSHALGLASIGAYRSHWLIVLYSQ